MQTMMETPRTSRRHQDHLRWTEALDALNFVILPHWQHRGQSCYAERFDEPLP
jgi:hypothetical protein